MVRSIVLGANTRPNDILAWNEVSKTITPTTILVDRPGTDYHVITQMPFGTYAQINDEPDTANGLVRRFTGAIALNPAGKSRMW